MKSLKNRILVVAFVGLFTISAGCAYILHPDRRGGGAKGGQMDTAALVMDILWLIPGLIPGIIALAVDFSTGAIYGSSSLGENNSDTKPINMVAGKTIKFNSKTPLNFTLRIDKNIIAQGAGMLDIPAKAPKGFASLDAVDKHGKKMTWKAVIQ
ncbi:hypothetical protein KKF34_08220 [Myxococcota bacterium]|nr:hypothetical protein [Myxococcota bacterium]MBU1381609.1 hypothetical protein [Myxococcota bacterium]MBU1496847.1 hypothetical protein [Myxococcota bacterium]